MASFISCKLCSSYGHLEGSRECPAYISPLENRVIPFKYSMVNVSALSNLFPCAIQFRGIRFNSLEQAYQYFKALFLENRELATRILESVSTETILRVAKLIGPAMPVEWDNMKLQLMADLLLAKYEQCEMFRQMLEGLPLDYILVEATANKFWAAGLGPDLVLCTRVTHYPGQNHLGRLIMVIRENMGRPDMADRVFAHVQYVASLSVEGSGQPRQSPGSNISSFNSDAMSNCEQPQPVIASTPITKKGKLNTPLPVPVTLPAVIGERDESLDREPLPPVKTRKPIMWPDIYTGKETFETYLEHFVQVAEINAWGDQDILRYFSVRLRDAAREFYSDLAVAEKASFNILAQRFSERFGMSGRAQLVKIELKNRKKLPNETWQELSDSVRHMVKTAYPQLRDRAAIEVECFVAAITDSHVLAKVVEGTPSSLQAATLLASKAEAVDQTVKSVFGKKVHSVGQDSESHTEVNEVNVLSTKMSELLTRVNSIENKMQSHGKDDKSKESDKDKAAKQGRGRGKFRKNRGNRGGWPRGFQANTGNYFPQGYPDGPRFGGMDPCPPSGPGYWSPDFARGRGYCPRGQGGIFRPQGRGQNQGPLNY